MLRLRQGVRALSIGFVDNSAVAVLLPPDTLRVARGLGIILAELRTRRRMSQGAAADAAGIALITMHRAEKGRPPRDDTLQAIVQAFNRKLALSEREIVQLAQAAHIDPDLVQQWCRASSAAPSRRPSAASDDLDRLFYELRSMAPDVAIRALLEAQIEALRAMRVVREDIDSPAGPAQILRGFDAQGRPLPPPVPPQKGQPPQRRHA